MQSLAVSLLPARLALLRRFQRFYLLLAFLFSSLTLAVIAWQWQQGGANNNGLPYHMSVPLLGLASVLINTLSFYFQNRYTHRLFQHPGLADEFHRLRFGVRFYLYNLAAAVFLAVITFFPLLTLLFFDWIYPLILWFVPYHLLMGLVLGRTLQQGLQRQARVS